MVDNALSLGSRQQTMRLDARRSSKGMGQKRNHAPLSSPSRAKLVAGFQPEEDAACVNSAASGGVELLPA
eukprot:4186765-Amphidinium_carterae.1